MNPSWNAEMMSRLLRNKSIVDGVGLAQARIALERARSSEPDIWRGEPLVSVRISTFNRPQLLVERAVASVLRQTYQNFELVIVGDHAVPETAEALARVGDPRIRYHNLPERPRYARFPRFFWATAGTYAVNAALSMCRGQWIAPLDDDDEFAPDHLECLLAEAHAKRLEMVYGQMNTWVSDKWAPLGIAPLTKDHICHGSVLYSARLLCLRYDPYAWVNDEPGDWNLWRRLQSIGTRIGFLDRVVGTHHPEYSSVDPEERTKMFHRMPTPEEFFADVHFTGCDWMLSLE